MLMFEQMTFSQIGALIHAFHNEACYQYWLETCGPRFKFPSRQTFLKRMMYLAPEPMRGVSLN